MVSKAMSDRILLLALLLMVSACGTGHTPEVAQSKAVRDRTRVLGMALMEDGTYQFRLCRVHQDYTAQVLAEECINPLVNEDGTARVFSNVPSKPGTALAKFRNWMTAALAGTIVGVSIYKLGRFYVKTKARDRLVGKARWQRHTAKVNSAKANNDFDLVTKLRDEGITTVEGKNFAPTIEFVENYSAKVEDNIKAVRDELAKAQEGELLKVDIDQLAERLYKARYTLEEMGDAGFNSGRGQSLVDSVEALRGSLWRLERVGAQKLSDELRAVQEEASILYARVHNKEGLRFGADELEALTALAESDKFAKAWLKNKEELSLLDGSKAELEKDFVKLKYVDDDTVEKLLRIDDVVEKNSHDRTLLGLKNRIAELSNDDVASDELAKVSSELKTRIKYYNPRQNTSSGEEQTKVAEILNTKGTATASVPAEEGSLLAKGLGKIGNGIRNKTKFLRDFPWIGESTVKYSKLNKITITNEDEVVTKLARDVEVKNIEVQQGVEKLTAQVAGVTAFLSLPLTQWSRYLPAHALLTAEKNWTEVTGGYASARRIEDMLTVLDGIAQATNSKVSPAAITFGL